MKLSDLLRSLLGDAPSSQDYSNGFAVKADSHGIVFFLAQKEFDALIQGKKHGTARVQLIVLRMLEEQCLAEAIPNGFRVDANSVAGLDDEQSEILNLPARFPGSYASHVNGRTGRAGFRVQIDPVINGQSLVFTRKGPYLVISNSEKYRLTPAELFAFESWSVHEALSAEQRIENTNLMLMAQLQTAKRSGMRIELNAFDRLEVHVPNDIGISATRLADGSLELCPSFGDGSTQDQLNKRWAQVDLHSDNGGALKVDNRIVLLSPEKVAAIKEVLLNRKISADQVDDFIRSPSAFIDATLVNLDLGFSVRVEGIGKIIHIDFATGDSTARDWFALDKLAAPVEAIAKSLKSQDDIDQFEEQVIAAWGQGADTLEFAGTIFDISDKDAVKEKLSQAQAGLGRTDVSSDGSQEEAETRERIGLIISDAKDVSESLLADANAAAGISSIDWSNIKRQAFPHQVEGVQWMADLIQASASGSREDVFRLQGAILADDMGLGKTYMCLAACGEYYRWQLAQHQTEKPVLVIAPLSLLENWVDEVNETFANSPFKDIVVLQSGHALKDYRIDGIQRESVQLAEIEDNETVAQDAIRYALKIGPEAGSKRLDRERRLVITTYQTLRDYQFSLCRIDWGLVIFDEAQNIKNPNAMQTRSAKALRADFKLLATGTPVENSLGDFWCLMDTAQPGLLGEWPSFRDKWIRPIEAAEDAERDALRSRLGRELRATVGPFMLRRTKEDQLPDLPTKTILGAFDIAQPGMKYDPSLAAVMTGAQLTGYDDVLDGYRRSRESEDMRGQALSTLHELRQISLHPRLREEKDLYASSHKQAESFLDESAKLKVILRQLQGIQDKHEKVILFMVTKRLQRLLKNWLDLIFGLDIAIINGDTSATPKKSDTLSRKQLIKKFEATAGFNILIMSPVAAGVGLTVVEANHVIHVERHWNPAKEAQASDRVYRIGQKRPVFIHLPAVLHPQFDSFDVHLDRLLQGKLLLKDALVTPDTVSEAAVMTSMGM